MTEWAGEFDLDHHGDLEVGDGLVDLAVNVRAGTPPAWLVEEITGSLADLASYPRQEAALSAVAARHGCEPSQVLLTAGAAEAFVLIARAFRPKHALVVHPQFTEPEAALRSAGHLVDRMILRPEDGFVLDPRAVPADADLVVIGNPTNPTSILHRAEDLRELARPDRILVVDEAFMDAVPGEPESLVGASIPGLIVIRSLTKTWGLAGLRVGYVVAAPGLIEQLAAVQPHWPVSTPALAAAIACSTKRAIDESAQAALEIDRQRAHLLNGLTGLHTEQPRLAGHPTIGSIGTAGSAGESASGSMGTTGPVEEPASGVIGAGGAAGRSGESGAVGAVGNDVEIPVENPVAAGVPAYGVTGRTASAEGQFGASGSFGADGNGVGEPVENPGPAGVPAYGLGSVATFGVARGPFVLVRVEGAAAVREALRERGFAVRRGDTFPGLGPDWLRIAVRPEGITDGFLKVWRDVLG